MNSRDPCLPIVNHSNRKPQETTSNNAFLICTSTAPEWRFKLAINCAPHEKMLQIQQRGGGAGHRTFCLETLPLISLLIFLNFRAFRRAVPSPPTRLSDLVGNFPPSMQVGDVEIKFIYFFPYCPTPFLPFRGAAPVPAVYV